MKLQNISASVKTIIIGILLAGGMGYIIAWTGPTATPPGGNVPAPLNVGQDSPIQEKLGGLRINTNSPIQDTVGLQVWGQSIFNGKSIMKGGIQIGNTSVQNQVLTATDNLGNADWKTQSSQSSGGTFCNTVQVASNPGGYTYGTVDAISLLDNNGNNMCTGTEGCAINIWDEGGINSTKTYIHQYGTGQVIYRQSSDNDNWLFSQNDRTGVNGDGTQTGLFSDWWSGVDIFDDATFNGTFQSENPASFITSSGWSEHSPNWLTIRNIQGHFFEISICRVGP